MPLIRIRRMGNHWATCGINIGVPEGAVLAEVSDLCPGLAPGQLVEVPDGHWTTDHPLLEVVRRPEKDEFIRPWVFSNADDAFKSNPSRSFLDADAIAEGLRLTEGAQEQSRQALAERERVRALEEKRERDIFDRREVESRYDPDRAEPSFQPRRDDDYQPRSDNRMTSAERDELLADEKPDSVLDEKPARSRRGNRR